MAEDMKFCPYCGYKLETKVDVCPNCGKQLTPKTNSMNRLMWNPYAEGMKRYQDGKPKKSWWQRWMEKRKK
ncbi:zinc ribbon domain-containing protein [Lentilactobacillus sp. Marseille-Q4993]|uniref:zinc ribbon domain-containing protein n=1 Tax=Lentilactobacillus sp. Marseille-Q4993 TaxID=3039492 RepID=UPI0024BD4F69|nr:zinc ribbon domain-containing protein [Lentilactobacillus sp. Marseille-Q4993]